MQKSVIRSFLSEGDWSSELTSHELEGLGLTISVRHVSGGIDLDWIERVRFCVAGN